MSAIATRHSSTVILLHCREGEQVTICYGPWPDDVFALFYGFLPRQPLLAEAPAETETAGEPAGHADGGSGGGSGGGRRAHLMPNPHDKVSLFADLRHVADFAIAQFGPRGVATGQREAWAAAVADELAAALGGDCQRYESQNKLVTSF